MKDKFNGALHILQTKFFTAVDKEIDRRENKSTTVFLVEETGLEPAISSTRRVVCLIFAHNYLHIVRIFR